MCTQSTPPELLNMALDAKQSVLPKKFKERYEFRYQSFLKWLEKNNAANIIISENILLAYFNNLSKTQSPSTLWSTNLFND